MDRRLRRTCLLLTAVVRASSPSIVSAQRSDPVPPRIDRACMVELTLRTEDTLAVSIPRPDCGDLQLVSLGPALVPGPTAGLFAIPIALENARAHAIRTPLEMEIDSVTQVRDGQQISQYFSHGFYEVAFWEGRSLQSPWRLGPSTEAPPPPEEGGTPSSLLPGKRTGNATIKLSVKPNARTLRLWIGLRGANRFAFPPSSTDPVAVRYPLDAAARALITATHFPKLRDSVGLYRDSARGLLIFNVIYGEPQDCPSGCFYSGALGISYRGRAGWLRVDAYDDSARATPTAGRMFEATQDDGDLFSLFLGRTDPRLGRPDSYVHRFLLSNLLHSPFVPRTLLQRKIDSLFGQIDQPMASLLVELPRVRADAGLLTSLAFLPNGYEGPRASALRGLRALAPQLVRDSSTSPWTMFALALSIASIAMDSALAAAIADHPHARDNPATLGVLAEVHPFLRGRAVAAAHASPRVSAELAARFAAVAPVPGLRSGREMLLDPEIRGNRDALRLLANLTTGRDTYIVYEAERLLPDTDFLRWVPRYTPLHSDAR